MSAHDTEMARGLAAPPCLKCQSDHVRPVPLSGVDPIVQYWSCEACGPVWATRDGSYDRSPPTVYGSLHDSARFGAPDLKGSRSGKASARHINETHESRGSLRSVGLRRSRSASNCGAQGSPAAPVWPRWFAQGRPVPRWHRRRAYRFRDHVDALMRGAASKGLLPQAIASQVALSSIVNFHSSVNAAIVYRWPPPGGRTPS